MSKNLLDTEFSDIKEEIAVWRFFHDLFRSPTREQWKWLNSDPVKQAWEILAAQLGAALPDKLPLPDTYLSYHEEFLAAFEVGAPTPPYPLIESHWNKSEPVARVVHENILFFKQFGLEIHSSALETADHLRYKLEFMSHLCELEIVNRIDNNSSERLAQLKRAKKDYIQRHFNSWLPALVSAIPSGEHKWYESWLNLCGRGLAGDRFSNVSY